MKKIFIRKRNILAVVAASSVLVIAAVFAIVNDSTPNDAKAATTGWMSGASGDSTGNGAFETWRGEPVTIAGDWNDISPAAQTGVWNLVPGGKYANWNKPIDIAIGAIFEGETWANAANGAYDARWRQAAQNARANWTAKGKNESYLYFRFGHEMNGGYPWKVMSGQEENYRRGWARWYGVMKSVLPQAHSVWCPSKENFGGATARPIDYFPDPATVDVVCVDWYNTYPWSGTVAQLDTQFNRMNGTQPVGLESWRKFAESKGKPFAIGEWGNASPGSNGTNNGGDNDVFMRYINNWMSTHGGTTAGKLLYEIYFNLWPEYQIFGAQTRQPINAATYRSLTWGTGGIYQPGGGTVTPAPTPTPPTPTPAPPAQISQTNNLVSGKTFTSTASDSTTEPGNPLSNVNDKNEATRWISTPTDMTSLTTDLGSNFTLNKVSILWAGNTVKNYDIQVSATGTTWTTVATGATNNTQKQLIDTTAFAATPTGRYLRIVAKDRWVASYGNSIFEIGAYGTTAAVPDTTKPTVTIQQPVTGTITPGTPVAFTATAADNIGVARVVFLVDGQTALTDTTSPYSYSWTAVAGTHSFAAQAFDAAGNSTLSPAISVNVQSPVASGGDVNADGRVNALDLSALISRDGQNYAPADFNGDGTVGAADMAILLSKWTW